MPKKKVETVVGKMPVCRCGSMVFEYRKTAGGTMLYGCAAEGCDNTMKIRNAGVAEIAVEAGMQKQLFADAMWPPTTGVEGGIADGAKGKKEGYVTISLNVPEDFKPMFDFAAKTFKHMHGLKSDWAGQFLEALIAEWTPTVDPALVPAGAHEELAALVKKIQQGKAKAGDVKLILKRWDTMPAIGQEELPLDED